MTISVYSKIVNCLFFCLLSLFAYGQERATVIDRPVFDVWNSMILEIDKIEISDSATIFHIDAFYYPRHWIRIDRDDFIRESGSDEKLVITGAEGIVIGRQTYMPESGTMSFKLFFPPLRPGVAKIDFCSEKSGGMQIWGIHLLPDAKVEFESFPEHAPAKTLPKPGYNPQTIQVNGKLSGFAEGYLRTNEIFYNRKDIITGAEYATTMPVAKDGSFSGEIITDMPGVSYIAMIPANDMPRMNLFMPSGKEVNIYIDLKRRSQNDSRYRTNKEPDAPATHLLGSSFANDELRAFMEAERLFVEYEELSKAMLSMNSEEFKEHLLDAMNARMDEIKQKGFSDNARMMAENSVRMEVYRKLLNYEDDTNHAYIRANNIKTLEEWEKAEFRAEKPDISYYSFMKGGLCDNMSYLLRYSILIESLMRNDLFNISDAENKSAKERFDYFREKFSPIAGTDKGVLFDVIQAKFYAQQLTKLKFFTDAEKQEIRDIFKDKPAYAETLIAENDRLAAQIAANLSNVESVKNDAPDVPMEQVFDAILAKHKGKVIVVDFWATWCGPCLQAMKTVQPLKEEMKGEDVVWMYITGETSPLSDWTLAYPGISGEHYRVNKEQWDYLTKTHGLQALPTFMVYDRNGTQVSKHTGFPGVDAMRNDIIKGFLKE